ncbi:hypothetical protein FRX31_016918 [Thalictrum thalictroides]|uniref:Uncharacterized protein n=1 Tax=Thalictrum thalictroides TaxID=46969 RepID=A0A7J6W7W2_THATH|nr:hypothetical protein FRX31_016918 [Thalictrum thalictroides]
MDKKRSLFPLPKSIIPFKIIAYNPRSKTLFLCIPNAVFSFDIAQRCMELIWGTNTPKFELSSYASPYVHSFAPIEVCPLVDSSAINMFEEKDAALKHDQKKSSAAKKKKCYSRNITQKLGQLLLTTLFLVLSMCTWMRV